MSRAAAALGHAFWGRSLFAMEWRQLCFVSYAVDPALLARELPPGLSLELRDGQALVTLTAFRAFYPSVLGVTPPTELHSTEIALRALVREGPRRGTVTLCEDSSSRAVAGATRVVFHERARSSPTRFEELAQEGAHTLSYEVDFGGRTHVLRVTVADEVREPAQDSFAYLVAQRPFGYAASSDGALLRYDLEHPLWRVAAPRTYEVKFDFARLYGDTWASLGASAPLDVTFAEGSAVRASLPE
jgi:uncharacterized protein